MSSARPTRSGDVARAEARCCRAGGRRRRAAAAGRPRSSGRGARRSGACEVGGVVGGAHQPERGDGEQRDRHRQQGQRRRASAGRARRSGGGPAGTVGCRQSSARPPLRWRTVGAARTSATRIARPWTTSSARAPPRAPGRRRADGVERPVDPPGAGAAVLGAGLVEPGGGVEQRRDPAVGGRGQDDVLHAAVTERGHHARRGRGDERAHLGGQVGVLVGEREDLVLPERWCRRRGGSGR